jgi:hypothetical protein
MSAIDGGPLRRLPHYTAGRQSHESRVVANRAACYRLVAEVMGPAFNRGSTR